MWTSEIAARDWRCELRVATESGRCQLTTRVTDYEQPEQFGPEERRQHDRSPLVVDVHFDGADSTGFASTKDMSAGGLYMSTRTEIPVGATLTLRIPMGNEHVVVKAEVVYSNPGAGVGVKFQDLSEHVRRVLELTLPQT